MKTEAEIKIIPLKDTEKINEVVSVHMQSFPGFFLTSLGKGFLRQLYRGFVEHSSSGVMVAVNPEEQIVGFLAYSEDLSGFYKTLMKKKIIPFAWYSVIAFLKHPSVMFRLLRALTYSRALKKEEKYVELSSLGVLPQMQGNGIGGKLIDRLKEDTAAMCAACKDQYQYIMLETDAVNNEGANHFYQSKGFVLNRTYETREGRKMNEYRWNII